MIKIDLKNGDLISSICEVREIIIDSDRVLKIFGHAPFLYKDIPFDEYKVDGEHISGLEDMVPYSVGQSLFVLINKGKVVEIASDYFGHSRDYYSIIDGIMYISDDWRELPHRTMEFDDFQLMYFMNWDETLSGETFYKDIKFFCPTYKYVIDHDVHKEFMQFKSCDTNGFHDSVEKTMKAISKMNKKVGMMLSGGMDSTEMTIAAENIDFHPKYYCAQIDDLKMFDNIQDCIGAKSVADTLDLDFTYAPCSIKNFLDGWNGELSKHVGFSYKDGKFWEAVSQKAKKDGIELLLNGNEADYLHNFGYTMEDKASEKDNAHDYFTTMRTVTRNKQLDDVFVKNEVSEDLLNNWKKFNKGDFSKERFLAWCMTNGNMYSGYRGLAVDEACSDKGKALYDECLENQMDAMIKELDNGRMRSTRHLVLEGFMIGEISGANRRCIMGAANANDVECLLFHATPLVYDASINMVFDDIDIELPKRESYEAVKDNKAYIQARKDKAAVKPEGLCTPSDVWRVILGVLNKEFDVDKCMDEGYGLLVDSGLFELDKLQDLAAKDIGIKVRIAWLGYIYSIYSKSLVA